MGSQVKQEYSGSLFSPVFFPLKSYFRRMERYGAVSSRNHSQLSPEATNDGNEKVMLQMAAVCASQVKQE
jgi:hypothetical protein